MLDYDYKFCNRSSTSIEEFCPTGINGLNFSTFSTRNTTFGTLLSYFYAAIKLTFYDNLMVLNESITKFAHGYVIK